MTATARDDSYYSKLVFAHIMGHDAETTTRALDAIYGQEDLTRVPLEKVLEVSEIIGTDPKRLVIDYGLGRNSVRIDDLTGN